jgi:hypothetical protein
MPKTHDVRLNGARVPRELMDRARAAAGERGFSAWIRRAMEHELEREVRNPVRTSAQSSTHIDADSA